MALSEDEREKFKSQICVVVRVLESCLEERIADLVRLDEFFDEKTP